MIRSLYLNLIQDMEVTDDISERLKKEILEILEDDEKETETGSQEYGQCRDKVFRIASAAEENGFVRGFRYAFHLIMECCQE
ncbi:hypothetical protein FMM74_021270 [Lachnospiraceae bacterium MD308]|nr:hypothetical protein [Lachnospiraceae bacterium MD308]